MKFKLNPLTGEFDYTSDSANKEKLNPMTGEFNLVEGDGPFSQIFNPLSGKLNLAIKAVIKELTGVMYIQFDDGIENGLRELTAYGGIGQAEGATTTTPKEVRCNDGAIIPRHTSGLPYQYQRVEYLETDGNAFVDTGLLIHNTDSFSITFQSAAATLTSPVMGAISGGSSYTSTQNFCVTYNQMSNIDAYCIYCDGAAGQPNAAFNAGDYTDMQKHTIVYNGVGVNPTLDGVDMTQLVTTTITPFEATVTTGLFGRKTTATNPTKAQAGVRIFDVDFFERGHFIPCKRITDNALGFYDVVNNTFVTSSTGTLTAGDPVEDGWTYDSIGTVEIIVNNFTTLDGQGTFVSPSSSSTNRGYKELGLSDTGHLKLAIAGGWEFIVQGKTGNTGRNISGWVTEFDGDVSGNEKYGIAVRKVGDGAFNYADFNGIITLRGVLVTPLLKVGDIADEHEVLSGTLTKKIGVIVLTGDENWSIASGTGYKQVHCDVIINTAMPNVSLVSNIAPYGCTAGTRSSYNFGCYTGTTSGRLCFQIKGDSSINSASDWVTYLRTMLTNLTPVYVCYPMATPTVDYGPEQELFIGKGTNDINIIQAELEDLVLKIKYLSSN